jgi:hypothetical protein
MSLLDECKAAAPAWMAAEGWVSVSRARCEWESGDGAASLAVFNADGMVRVIGWVGDLCMADVRADRKRTGSALSYVAGEVRAEMVARGIAAPDESERWVEQTAKLGLRRLTADNDAHCVIGPGETVAVLSTLGEPAIWTCRVVRKDPVDPECKALRDRRALRAARDGAPCDVHEVTP